MKKSFFKKSLALLLSVTVLLVSLVGALSVFAEDAVGDSAAEAADPYGTVESGILNDSTNKYSNLPHTQGPKNLDFSEGLRYWGDADNKGVALSDYLVPWLDADGNAIGYGFNPSASWQYAKMSNVRFDAAVAAGATINITLKFIINPKFTQRSITYMDGETQKTLNYNGINIMFDQYDETGKQLRRDASFSGFISNDNHLKGEEVYYTAYSAIPVQEGATTFAFQMQDATPTAANAALVELMGENEAPMYITEVFISTAVLNEDGSETKAYTSLADGSTLWRGGLPEGGTEENGIFYPSRNDANYVLSGDSIYTDANNQWRANGQYPIMDGFINGDFSEGFKYWGFRSSSAATAYYKISDAFEITSEGAVRFKGAVRDDPANTATTYFGLAKNHFTLPGVGAGDKLKVVFEGRNTGDVAGGIDFTFFETTRSYADTMNTSWYGEYGYVDADGATQKYTAVSTNMYSPAKSDTFKTYNSGVLTVIHDNPTFRIRSQVGKTEGGIEFKNVRILKDNGDNTWVDVMTNTLYYADGSLVGGTYEQGINAESSSNYMAHYTGPYGYLQNGDFSEGLKFWGGRQNNISAYKTATIKTENGNTYITHTPENDTQTYAGLMSALFTLPQAKAGDKLVVLFKYRNGDASNYQTFMDVVNADTANDSTWVTAANSNTTVLSAPENGGWGYARSTSVFTVGTKLTAATDSWIAGKSHINPSYNDAANYIIQFSNKTANVSLDVDDFQIVKYIDTYTVETFDGEIIKFAPAWAGSYSTGASTAGNSDAMNGNHNNDYYVLNGDFSDGLKYWGPSGATATEGTYNASQWVNLVEAADGNTYIQFKGELDASSWNGIRSGTIFVPEADLAVGDKVGLVVDVYDPNGDASNVQFRLDGRNGTGSGFTGYISSGSLISDNGNGWKTYMLPMSASGITATNSTWAGANLADNDRSFNITIAVTNGKTSTAAFDNIRMVKLVDSVESNKEGYIIGYKIAEVGGTATYTCGIGYGGSASEGLGTTLANNIGAFEGVQNGDFSDGLKYWGGRTTAWPAATTVTPKVDADGTTYVTHTPANDTQTYAGLMSSLFTLPQAKAGDKLVVLFKYRNGDASNYQTFLNPWNADTTNDAQWVKAAGSGTTVAAEPSSEYGGWGYAFSTKPVTVGTQITVQNDTWMSQHLYTFDNINEVPVYSIEMSNSVAGASMDITDIQIVKYISATTFETFDGEIIKFTPTWAGTYDDGVETGTGETSEMNSKYSTEYGVANGDFSDGLKYWGATGRLPEALDSDSVYAYGSSYVDLVTEGDNTYFKFDGIAREYFAGIKSGALVLSKETLAIGDYVAVKFDVYDPDNNAKNVQIDLSNRAGAGFSSRCNVNQCTLVEDKGNGWKTYVSKFVNPVSAESTWDHGVAAGDWAFHVVIQVQSSDKNEDGTWKTERISTACFDNVEIVRSDRGGFGIDAPAVALDGSALANAVMGDANNDGKVDLIDLVRAKKYAVNASAGDTVPAIVFAYADADATGAVDAGDFTAIINKILGI